METDLDVFWVVILGLHLIPVFGTVAGMIREEQETRRIRGTCPACNHPEHWPWCRDCGCDLFTEPED
jgi:hypothetical protein